jgi:hypothetical protein
VEISLKNEIEVASTVFFYVESSLKNETKAMRIVSFLYGKLVKK